MANPDETVTSSETLWGEEVDRVDPEPQDEYADGYEFGGGQRRFKAGLGPYGPEDTGV